MTTRDDTVNTVEIADIYRLTGTQRGLLFHTLAEPGSGAYVEQVRLRLRGPLRVDAFRAAWDEAIARHPALRTGFVWQGLDDPVQVVAAEVRAPEWHLGDWRDTTPLDQQARLAEYLAADRARGFDLLVPPLARFALLRLSDDEHLFVWTAHHLIVDGWSFAVVLREVLDRYADPHAPAVPAPGFRDHVAWLSAQDPAEAEKYWGGVLSGRAEPTALRIARPEPVVGETYGEHRVELSATRTAALIATARRQQVTLNTVLQGCWAVLLAVYSGDEDVVFGAAVAGRPAELPGAQDIVGPCITTLPVRVLVSGDQPVGAWLRLLQDDQSVARQFEHLPLARVQAVADVPPGTPLFETLMGFENYPVDDELFAGAGEVAVGFDGSWSCSHYPLTLLVEPGERLGLHAMFDRRRLSSSTVEGLLDQLGSLLDAFAGDPEQPLSRFGPATATAGPVEQLAVPEVSIIDLFDAQVRRAPRAIAVVDGDREVTYRELSEWADAVAARVGPMPGAVLGVCAHRSVELVVGVLAALKTGAAYLPLDPVNPRDRLAALVADAGADTVLVADELADQVPEAVRAVSLAPGAAPAEPVRCAAGADDLAYVMYTSGSTGRPKGVEVRHRQVVALFAAAARWAGFGPHDTWSLFHSFAFDFSVWELFGALLHGGSLVVVPLATSRSPERFADLVEQTGVTVLNQTPSAFRQLCRAVADRDGLDHDLRLVVFGGEALDPAGLREWTGRFGFAGPRLVNMYGITETTVHVTWHELTESDVDSHASVIGVPLAGTEVRLLDLHGNPVPDGVAGEVFVAGPGLARGYRGAPELTAQRFVTAPDGTRLYRSGDLARRRPDGVLEFAGRADDQVKVRGFRVEPGEIEAVLAAHPAVHEVAVTLREDGRLAAYVAPDERTAGAALRLAGLRAEAGPDAEVADLPDGATIFTLNRSETDFMAREIVTDEVYLQGGVTLPDDAVIVDVGANIGLFAVWAAGICANPAIYAVEPMPPAVEVLERNVRLHGIRGAVLPHALGEAETTTTFSYYPYASVLSGRYASAEDERRVVKSFLVGQVEAQGVEIGADILDELLEERLRTVPYECRVRRLSDVLREHGIDRVDLLKIDVEKSELAVLAGLDDADFAKVAQVVVEVHHRDGRLETVTQLLRDKGFRVEVRHDPQLEQTGLHNVYAVRPDAGLAPPAGRRARWRGPSALVAELRRAAVAALPEYMRPATWTLLPAIPVTASGKRDRRALPAPDSARPVLAGGYVAPGSALEQRLCQVWQEVLGLDRVGVTDDFFALGGHSLLVTQLVVRVRDELGVQVPLQTVFDVPTVTGMAEVVERLAG
ncbi:non-ribosomal peptide synthetase [Labedaea rhizosphaerae]|uniref:FkbM family methyltransferase/amino acid adenylation domain-containing protein n=1 Tax=Labedaea rhizosphaerae TaxID=598644 RepID=A0A4R6S0L2_LABRH|nr:non-ribosomal peptide synthetase [Labedaea rhizosphaerae]TDP93021.1 FkbM family methyltransferase/amino acid adenylation domain-containing protein [Labedaea rhizosphaerae]